MGTSTWLVAERLMTYVSGTAVTAKQARLKKESAEKCDDSNAAHCYDHTTNRGIGPVKVSDKFPAADQSTYDYSEVLHKSFLFYFQQRSGKLPHQVRQIKISQFRQDT